MNGFSASNMQLFFALDRRGCFGAKLNDFSASNMQLFFLSGSKKLLWSEIERFSASNMQLFFLWRSKKLLWSEIERFFSLEHAAVFSLEIEEAVFGHKTRRNKPEERGLAF